MHKPINIKNIVLPYNHISPFSYQITYGERIGVIGRNGCGKSSLLIMLFEIIRKHHDINIAYVPQLIDNDDDLSGGEKLIKAIDKALSDHPHIILLDEPTNHLDTYHRENLLSRLRHYHGTIIMASHDSEILHDLINKLWHINNEKINIFLGNYKDYINDIKIKRLSIASSIKRLQQEKKLMHHKLMQEQERASKSRIKGEKSIKQKKWPTVVSKAKAQRAAETTGRKKSIIDQEKSILSQAINDLRLPEIILPSFNIDTSPDKHKTLIQINHGSIGYATDKPLLTNINFILLGHKRIAFRGNNGSGKSSLVKAMLDDNSIYKRGDWYILNKNDIGYLAQDYKNLHDNITVFAHIAKLKPSLSHAEIRHHLSSFLFRSHEEVHNLAKNLSQGEKARLSLAQIAIKTPKVLILDEITNNLDIETKMHVIEVLKSYPGAMIMISHEKDFLKEINIDEIIDIDDFK